jgi:hypothetical protein
MPKVLERWKVMRHGPLEEIDDGLLTVAGDLKMPLGDFPRRMTVVGLKGRRTAIYSAIALEEPGMARIEALGDPAFLIVPGDLHRMDALIWKRRYPDAKVIAPPGALAAVQEVVPVDATEDVLDDPDVRYMVVPGVEGHEAALMVRRPTGATLIVNDIIGHVAHPHGLGAHVIARLFSFGVSEPQIPRPVRAKIVRDRPALAAQLRAWAEEPGLRRIIVSHGDPIETLPKAVLNTLAETLED